MSDEAMDSIEKLHEVATRSVQDLLQEITARVGFKVHGLWIDWRGTVFCYPTADADPCNNLNQPLCDMVAQVAGFDPLMRDKARLREIEAERSELLRRMGGGS